MAVVGIEWKVEVEREGDGEGDGNGEAIWAGQVEEMEIWGAQVEEKGCQA